MELPGQSQANSGHVLAEISCILRVYFVNWTSVSGVFFLIPESADLKQSKETLCWNHGATEVPDHFPASSLLCGKVKMTTKTICLREKHLTFKEIVKSKNLYSEKWSRSESWILRLNGFQGLSPRSRPKLPANVSEGGRQHKTLSFHC